MTDQRSSQRETFLKQHLTGAYSSTALRPDASFRRYFRIGHGQRSLMLMDAPPPMENPEAFVMVTRELEQLGARVPKILHADIDQGFLLIEDLGDQTMTRLLGQGESEQELYQTALEALIEMQRRCHQFATLPQLPIYDQTATLAESDLFADWYLPAARGAVAQQDTRLEFHALWARLFNDLPPLKAVLVHRDFHVDNLIISDGQCAMLDYQDAVLGSPVYDLVSLVQDARRDLAPGLADQLTSQWLEQRTESIETLQHHLAYWSAQRHTKVAGIFVRLWLRDEKPDYLVHLNRVMRLLEASLQHPALKPLKQWLETQLESFQHQAFTSDAERLRAMLL